MKVNVGGQFYDKAKDSFREVHVELTSEDLLESIDPDVWNAMTLEDRFNRLTMVGDILVLKYAATRGFRYQESVQEEIAAIMRAVHG